MNSTSPLPTSSRLPTAYAAHPVAASAYGVDERPSGRTSQRSYGREVRRVLLASEDRRFLASAAARLRTTPIHFTLVTEVDKVVREVARARPHVLIISQAMIEAAPALEGILPKRHPGLPVLVVRSVAAAGKMRDWRVASWGGVGVVDKDELLRGRVLPLIIMELASLGPGGGTPSP